MQNIVGRRLQAGAVCDGWLLGKFYNLLKNTTFIWRIELLHDSILNTFYHDSRQDGVPDDSCVLILIRNSEGSAGPL